MCINRCYVFICCCIYMFMFSYMYTGTFTTAHAYTFTFASYIQTWTCLHRHAHLHEYCFIYIVCFFLMHIVLIYISFHLLIASFQSDDRACNCSKGVHFCSPNFNFIFSVFIKVLFLKFLFIILFWEAQSHVPFCWLIGKKKHWVVVSNIFYFHHYLGKIPNLTNIFQRGWNHQLEQLVTKTTWIILVARRLFYKVTEMDRRLGDGWRAWWGLLEI